MAIRIGTAPDSWGVWFPKNDKQTPWQRCMDEMQQSGYDGVELGPWGYFPNTFDALEAELKNRNLTLVAATVGGNFLNDSSIDAMLKTVDDVAGLQKKFPSAQYIVLLPEMYTDLMTGKQTMNPQLTPEQWDTMFKNIRRADKYISDKYGLVATLHPHVECHIETEEEIEKVLDNTDIALCLDTGHHIYGGGEPVSFYKKHHTRIPYIHIKDCDMAIKKEMTEKGWPFAEAVVKGIMCEPGKGGIDFKQLFGAMHDVGYDGWAVVEQDLYPVPSFDLPLEIATRTRAYLRSVGV